MAAMPDPKFCVDCRHCFIPQVGGAYAAECRHPDNVTTDVVTGRPKPIYQWCENMRRSASPCGPDAAWFAAKEGA